MTNSRSRLDEIYKSILTRREAQNRLRKLTVRGPGLVDFSSNSYLSLSNNADLRKEYLSKLEEAGAFALGSGGSRLLDGNTAVAEKVEVEIATFHNSPAGLLFNSGFEANTGLFSCAPQPGDYMVYDELIHASVHDGMKLSRARTIPFAHNCVIKADVPVSSQLMSLDDVLRGLLEGDDRESLEIGTKNIFIAVEGVYSMDGDVAPLTSIVECVERRLPAGNGYIIVDEAHSTGWLGERGRGLVCHLGLEDRIWARVHTFGKAMGCAGAIVLCTPTTRSYLINYARSLIYTTAMAYPMLAAIQASYEYLRSGRADRLLKDLFSIIDTAHVLLLSICQRYRPPPQLFRINIAPPESPIIPVFSEEARSLAQYCQQKGYMIRPIVAPTVPKGTDRLRLCIHAANTMAEVRGFCMTIEQWLQERLLFEETPSRLRAAKPAVTSGMSKL